MNTTVAIAVRANSLGGSHKIPRACSVEFHIVATKTKPGFQMPRACPVKSGRFPVESMTPSLCHKELDATLTSAVRFFWLCAVKDLANAYEDQLRCDDYRCGTC